MKFRQRNKTKNRLCPVLGESLEKEGGEGVGGGTHATKLKLIF